MSVREFYNQHVEEFRSKYRRDPDPATARVLVSKARSQEVRRLELEMVTRSKATGNLSIQDVEGAERREVFARRRTLLDYYKVPKGRRSESEVARVQRFEESGRGRGAYWDERDRMDYIRAASQKRTGNTTRDTDRILARGNPVQQEADAILAEIG